MSRPYPGHLESDVVLRDGRTVHVRPVRPADRGGLAELYESLSPDSRQMRFFSPSVNVENVARWASEVDYERSFGLVCTTGPGGRIVAHGAWQRTDEDRAEVAFTIRDEFQGRGIGSILLGHLASAANEVGIPMFYAEVLPQNHRMVELFRRSGFPVEVKSYPGEIVISLPTSISPEAFERFERREQSAAVAAMRSFLVPSSVAVIGASRDRSSVGGAIFDNLITRGFAGPVYPVNEEAEEVQSVPAYASVTDVPGKVELAVVTVPAPSVVEVGRACADKGVRSLVVVSSGFSERGAEGERLERELLTVCREAGMRLIGPNCMGLVNTDPEVLLDATFAPVFPRRSGVAFLSQGGALGLAVLDYVEVLGLGLSSFVSLGNKADVSGNDLLHYWEADEATTLILLYLESFGNPRKFGRITRRVARTKPVIAVKSGRRGERGTHTGFSGATLISSSDEAVDALFREAGVIRTNTLSELFDVATLLSTQPAPRGNRVAVLSNATAPAAMCADACEADGLEVAALPGPVQEALRRELPDAESVANPVSLGYAAGGNDYRDAIRELAACDEVDAIIVIFIPPVAARSAEVATAIRETTRDLERELPILSVFMSARGMPSELKGAGTAIPSFAFPEDAARALARATRYGVWRRTPPGKQPRLDGIRREEAAVVIAGALGDEPRLMRPDQAAALLECYGIALVEQRIASSPEQAAGAAGELGGRVAVKVVSENLVDKTELGGVALDLRGAEAVRAAAERMGAAVEAAGHPVEGFIVQSMAPPGAEVLVAMTDDPSLGPVIAVGAGGVEMELLKHAAVRLVPLTDREARDMVRSLRTFPLLEGFRGRPRADVEALEDLLLRISTLVDNHHEVAALDCHPVVVLPEGVVVVDARIKVAVPAPKPPISSRRTFV